jgi:PEGA domain
VLAILGKPETDRGGDQSTALHPTPVASSVSGPPNSSPAVVAHVTHLSLTSNPEQSEIQINGVFAGNTPLVMDLPSDPQIITISKKGFKPWTRVIKLTGGTISILADLDPLDKAASSQ